MKKSIILLAILALLILVVPFVYARLSDGSGEPIPILTPEPSATPEPTIEVDEIVLQTPGESSTSVPDLSPTPEDRTPLPVTDEPVWITAAPYSPATPTSVPHIPVPQGAAFVLTIRGKNITIAKDVDEKALEQSPGWLNSSAKPGQEGVCVVYGHRNRNHLQVLKDVSYGDKILVSMPDGKTYTYVIESTEILESNDDLRIPTIEGKHLMLTTCYPFYYTGHAPKKYVVIAVLS